MSTDYQAQVTLLYNKLTAIDSTLAKLVLLTTMNSMQTTLTNTLNTLTGRLNTLEAEVQSLQLAVSDLLTQLRSH